MQAIALINKLPNERLQKVNVNEVIYDWIEVEVGALFFNFYFNDIQKRISHEFTLVHYANDCMMFLSSLSENDTLNQLQSTKFIARTH